MTFLEWYAFVILPLIVLAIGEPERYCTDAT